MLSGAVRSMSALGQKQTFAVQNAHVRFTPKSGHMQCTSRCPLSAISGHSRRTKACPLCPRKQTLALHKSMSAKGQ